MSTVRRLFAALLIVAYSLSALSHIGYAAEKVSSSLDNTQWVILTADGDDEAHEVIPEAPACHCVHAAVPLSPEAVRFLKIGGKWPVTALALKVSQPDIPTPPPRMLGSEAHTQTSIPTHEVSHVSLCTDRIHRARHPVERTG